MTVKSVGWELDPGCDTNSITNYVVIGKSLNLLLFRFSICKIETIIVPIMYTYDSQIEQCMKNTTLDHME